MVARVFFLALLGVGFLLFPASNLQAGYIWTPQTGKWVNPKNAVKDTPEEQLNAAMATFNSGQYVRAIKEFQKAVKYFPKSKEAAEAQYMVGRCYEPLGNYWHAYEAYQKTVEEYPYTNRFDEIVERQYKLGELYYQGAKYKELGIALFTAFDKAAEIFKKVQENAPYGRMADQALFMSGQSYKKAGLFTEATDVFIKLAKEYPGSPFLEQAKYEVAYTNLQASARPAYDQAKTEEAIEKFQAFVKEHPESPFAPEAQKALDDLRRRKAEHYLEIAQFYDKLNQLEAALRYYDEIVRYHSDSPQFAAAEARAKKIEAVLEGMPSVEAPEARRLAKQKSAERKQSAEQVKKDAAEARRIAQEHKKEREGLAREAKRAQRGPKPDEGKQARLRKLEREKAAREALKQVKMASEMYQKAARIEARKTKGARAEAAKLRKRADELTELAALNHAVAVKEDPIQAEAVRPAEKMVKKEPKKKAAKQVSKGAPKMAVAEAAPSAVPIASPVLVAMAAPGPSAPAVVSNGSHMPSLIHLDPVGPVDLVGGAGAPGPAVGEVEEPRRPPEEVLPSLPVLIRPEGEQAPAVPGLPPVVLNDIQVEPQEPGLILRITSDRPLEFAHFMLREPHRIIIDPVDNVLTQMHDFVKPEGDLVKSIRLIPAYAEAPKEAAAGTTSVDFIVIALRKPCRYEIVPQDKTLIVQIHPLEP